MVKAICYKESGRITELIEMTEASLCSFSVSEDEFLHRLEGGETIETASGYFFDLNEKVVKKCVSLGYTSFSDGLSFFIEGLPLGTSVVFSDLHTSVDTENDAVEIEFETSGTYEIDIYPPPQYKSETLEITVG